LNFHDLRGTAATNFFRAEFSIREIAEPVLRRVFQFRSSIRSQLPRGPVGCGKMADWFVERLDRIADTLCVFLLPFSHFLRSAAHAVIGYRP